MNPSTEDILEAMRKKSCKGIYYSPNNKNIILAAEQQLIFLIKNYTLFILKLSLRE
jgi:dihydroxyacetone kinase-like predicted kinase